MAVSKRGLLVLLAITLISQASTAEEAFKCPANEGVFAHPEDCVSYYQCQSGQATLRSCSDPLHFNSEINDCDWPLSKICSKDEYKDTGANYLLSPSDSAAEAPPGVVCPDDLCVCRLPHPYNCDSYYVCDKGRPVFHRCPEGLHYNPSTQVCDLKENVNCRPKTTTTKAPPTTTTRAPTTTTRRTTTTQKETTQGVTTPPGCPAKCPKPYGLFPCPENCRWFIHCSHNIPYAKICPANLHFNPVLRVCDWPDRAGCPGNGTTPTDPPVVGDCDCDCCLITDWNDCSKYYLCLNNKKHHMSCSEGLYFNHKTENCDKRENLDRWCPEKTTPPPPTTTTRRTTTTQKETTQGVTTQPGCPATCPKPYGLFPCPGNCRWFIHCSHNIPYSKICPANLHFNPVLRVCDWPDRAGCPGNGTTPTDPPVVGDCDCDCCLITDWNDCSKYYLCLNNKKHHMSCSEGLYFNHKTENCDKRENLDRWCPEKTTPAPTTTTQAVTTQPGCPATCPKPYGLFPCPGNCRWFIHCSHNIPYPKICPANLHFNPVLKVCDWPDRAGCGGPTGDPISTTPPGGVCDCDCCLIKDEDCTKYHLCLGNIKYPGQCSDGLFFNDVSKTCDKWENLNRDDCGGETTPTPEVTTTTLRTTTSEPDETTCPPPPKCPNGDDIFPDKDDCAVYYRCKDGVMTKHRCCEGLNFNPITKVCDNYDCNGPTIGNCSCDCCFLPDDCDCSVYYLCFKKHLTRQKCAKGLVFDPKLETCNFPGNVDRQCPPNRIPTFPPQTTTRPPRPTTTPTGRPPFKCPAREGHFRHPDCRKFYHCANWYPYVKDCPANLHWSVDRDRCEYPCIAKCDPSVPSCHDDTDKTTVWVIPTTTTIRPIGFRCPARDGHFPHPDCTKFYHCSNYYPYVKDCPAGLHWSIARDRCEWPCIARCDPTVKPCPTAIPVTTTVTPTNGLPTFKCDVREGLFPHPDCGKFYQCSNYLPYEMPCPAGLHFSVEYQRCEWPCIAKCDPKVKPCPTHPTPPTGVTPTTTTPGDCSCMDCVLHDPSDCASYYKCRAGKLQKHKCPPGQLFDRSSKKCVAGNLADCPNIVDPEMCKKPSGIFPMPGSCKHFIQCDHGIGNIIECPKGTEFNPDLLVCDWPNGKCGSNSTVDKRCKRPTGLFPHPDTCEKFIHCDHGIAYVKDCPKPLHFNPKLRVCDWADRAGCGTDPGDGGSDEDEFVWGCKETPGILCPPCACRIPNYTSCSSFYQCTDKGVACSKNCPPGLHFNRKTRVCDIPANAGCSD